MRRLRDLRWLGVLAVTVVVLGTASVAYGGGRWRGIDPELGVDGYRVNVVVAVPPGTWCRIDGPIEFEIAVPDLDTTYFVGESAGEMVPGKSYTSNPDHTRCGAYTHTSLSEHTRGEGVVFVKGRVNSDTRQSFPVDITVSVNGIEQVVCSGRANQTIKCTPVYLR